MSYQYAEYARQVLEQEMESLSKIPDTIDPDTMEKIVDLLLQVKKGGHKVLIAGCGTSGAAAKQIAHIMNVVTIPCFFLSPTGAIHGDLGAVSEGDAVILITKGGQTPALLDYVEPCRLQGATLIAVTEDPESELARASHIVLKIKVDKEADPWGLVAATSSLAVMAVWDAIILATMPHSGFTKEDFLRIHAGGAVGVKLQRELQDPAK